VRVARNATGSTLDRHVKPDRSGHFPATGMWPGSCWRQMFGSLRHAMVLTVVLAGASNVNTLAGGERWVHAAGEIHNADFAGALAPARSGRGCPLSGLAADAQQARGVFVANNDEVKLLGTYTDRGIDANGNGRFDSLRLAVGVQAINAGSYRVTACVVGDPNLGSVWATATEYLEEGNHTVGLDFDGMLIWQWRTNGPFNVSRVEARNAGEILRSRDSAENAHTTAAYLYTDFEPLPAALSGAYGDVGVDLNGNGLFDVLRLSVGVEVHEVATYTVRAQLDGTDMQSATVMLTEGHHNVELNFDGQDFFHRRADGPYTLQVAEVQVTPQLSDRSEEAYTTQPYSYQQFENSGVVIDITADQPEDANGDGLYDYLSILYTLDGPIFAYVSPYEVEAVLFSDTAEIVARQSASLSFDSPPGSGDVFSVRLPGGTIRRSGLDGPYTVSLTLVDADGILLDHRPRAHQTAPYNHDDFGPPPVTLTGEFSDWLEDADGNGLYEHLNIDVGTLIGDRGEIIAEGILADSNNELIERVRTSHMVSSVAYIGVGTEVTMTLRFSGARIAEHGQDGPYKLRALLIYHVAYPEQREFVADAHMTEPYPVSLFGHRVYPRLYLPALQR